MTFLCEIRFYSLNIAELLCVKRRKTSFFSASSNGAKTAFARAWMSHVYRLGMADRGHGTRLAGSLRSLPDVVVVGIFGLGFWRTSKAEQPRNNPDSSH